MIKEILIETKTPDEIIEVFDRLKAKGLEKKDYEAYLPYASHSLLEKMRPEHPKLSPGIISSLSAIFGFCLGMIIQVYPNVYGYPLRVGGHDHFSWYAFLIISIELAIFFGGFSLLTYLIFNLYHRGKGEGQILEECPSQMFALKIKHIRPSFEQELEEITKDINTKKKEIL